MKQKLVCATQWRNSVTAGKDKADAKTEFNACQSNTTVNAANRQSTFDQKTRPNLSPGIPEPYGECLVRMEHLGHFGRDGEQMCKSLLI